MSARMKSTITIAKCSNNGSPSLRVIIPQAMRHTEKTSRRFFPDTPEGMARAEELVERLLNQRQSWSARLTSLPETEQGIIIRCLERVKWDVALLDKATENFEKKLAAKNVKLQVAIDEFVAMKQGDKTPDHVRQIKSLLDRFAGLHKDALVNDVTNADFNAFLTGNGWNKTSRRYCYAIMHSFFAWAKSPGKGYCAENPCDATDKPKAEKKAIRFFSCDELAALLRSAFQIDRPMVSYIAIGALAGPRAAELSRMTSDMVIDGNFSLPDAVCKNGDGREVPISRVLMAWLDIDCSFGWTKVYRRLRAIAAHARVSLHRNALRHTFGTHNKSVMGDVRCAEAMGNTIPILKKHYKGKVASAEVQKYNSDFLMPANVLKGLWPTVVSEEPTVAPAEPTVAAPTQLNP